LKSQQYEDNILQQVLDTEANIESQINVLFDVAKNILDDGAIRARTVKFKLQKHIKSNDIYKRAYALNRIVSEGKGIDTVPTEENIDERH